jgi:DNA-binding CsgD family transcriptional regulator
VSAADPADHTDPGQPEVRRVLVAEPLRFVRDALIAAVDAQPGLVAIDGSRADRSIAGRADAVIVAAGLLRVGWHRVLADGSWDDGPSPVVVVADHGPVTPSIDRRGIVVVSRHTPLAAVVACLRSNGSAAANVPEWLGTSAETTPQLTARERQVLGLLASGLSPAEVARSLAITIHTTRDHIKAIRTKLDRPTTLAAVLEAIRRGLLHMDVPSRM